MSKIIPQELVTALRNNHDVTMDVMGVDVQLFIPTNLNSLEDLDIYNEPTDTDFDEYAVQAFIEWSPGTQRLRKLSLFTEKDIPIICWLPNRIKVDDVWTHLPTTIKSYIRVPTQFIPDTIDVDEFEVIDSLARNFHDSIVNRPWKLAPRRYREDASYNT